MDLNALLALLSGLGPWGIPVGIAIMLAVQWLRKRVNLPAIPSDPSKPNPGPAPNPLEPLLPSGPNDKPLREILLKLLPLLLARKHAVVAPVQVATVAVNDPVEDELLKVIGEIVRK